MRTTIDIPDAVFRRAKSAAALEGKTLKRFVVDAITHELGDGAGGPQESRRVTLPLVRSRNPGSLSITADTVADALNAEDLHALARH